MQLALQITNWEMSDLCVEDLGISPMNVRADVMDQAHIESIAEAINSEGYSPNKALLVNKRNGELRVMAGSNRLRALRLLGKNTAPCYVFTGLTDDQEAQYSRLDNVQDERHKPEHFLDVAEAYRRLNEGEWTQPRIAEAYGESLGRVNGRIKIAGIPEIVKLLVRGQFQQLSKIAESWSHWVAENKFQHAEHFRERHFEEITKLKRRRRIIQICKEIVENKGEWKHAKIKKRAKQLQGIDDGLRIAWGVMDKGKRRELWKEVERGYHLDLVQLQELVDKLNAEYSRITLYHKSFFDMTDEEVPDESVDLIYADPPYGVSDGGITYHSGKIKSVDKGEWDKEPPEIDSWVALCYKKLKPNGSIYVSGTFHNIYEVGVSLKKHGFTIRNEIIWEKEAAAPTIVPKYYAFWHESVIFATKSDEYSFEAEQIKKYSDGKQMKDIWRLGAPRGKEKVDHSTQKPETLLVRIITASCPVSGLILDPFAGSGTTLVVAKRLLREAVGYEIEAGYVETTRARLRKEK